MAKLVANGRPAALALLLSLLPVLLVVAELQSSGPVVMGKCLTVLGHTDFCPNVPDSVNTAAATCELPGDAAKCSTYTIVNAAVHNWTCGSTTDPNNAVVCLGAAKAGVPLKALCYTQYTCKPNQTNDGCATDTTTTYYRQYKDEYPCP